MPTSSSGGRVEMQPGFVLHRRPYRDTSSLLEVFTQGYGRMGLVARGARGPKSRWQAILQPFQPLLISWIGKGDLKTLVGAEAVSGFPDLIAERLASGFYVNELLLRTCPRADPHPRLFDQVQRIYRRLAGSESCEPALREFERVLLDELGYGLQLDVEANTGRPVRAESTYDYLIAFGPVRVNDDAAPRPARSVAPSRLDATGKPRRSESPRMTPGRIRIDGDTLLALAAGEIVEPPQLRQAKQLMRAALGDVLGDRPLRSREVFAALHASKRMHRQVDAG